jgi:hypothetical protein
MNQTEVENVPEKTGAKKVGLLRRRPTWGVFLAGSAALVAASTIGVGEVAVAIAAGYAAYRVLTRDRANRGEASRAAS